MKTFKQYLDEKVKQPTGDLKKACWTGYTAIGTKQKNGATVPNCVHTGGRSVICEFAACKNKCSTISCIMYYVLCIMYYVLLKLFSFH